MQGGLLDEPSTGAHETVELGASRLRGEGVEQVGFGVAVEVPLADDRIPLRDLLLGVIMAPPTRMWILSVV